MRQVEVWSELGEGKICRKVKRLFVDAPGLRCAPIGAWLLA